MSSPQTHSGHGQEEPDNTAMDSHKVQIKGPGTSSEVINDDGNESNHQSFQHTSRLLALQLALCALTFNSGIDTTIINTSLPTIMREIGGVHLYAWVAQSYLFACTVPQPFYGQIANIFGRRGPLLVSIALFAIGSGIAGGARNVATLIAGRVVQGLGTAGINVIPEIIVCDMVPPRYRGPYLSTMLSTAAIGSTVGPVIGGALAVADWRWVFWLNIPVSAVTAVAIVWLMRHDDTMITQSMVAGKDADHIDSYGGGGNKKSWLTALGRVDWLGNAIFIPSMVSLFFGLISGGTEGYPWASWRTILPLVLGVVGWAVFHVHQSSHFCREPTVPPWLFRDRTVAMAFIVIFMASIIIQAVCTFLPIYFQAIKQVSPLTSGVYFLPFALALLPFGGVAAGVLSKTGRYRELHWAGFALLTVGVGLFSQLIAASSTGHWIGYQIIAAAGAGFIFTASLPSTLAALPEKDVATATGTFAFVRALGMVWGITMSAIIFNGQIDDNLGLVEDAGLRQLLQYGAAYAFASGSEDGQMSIARLAEPSKSQVISLYERALRVLWFVFVGISVIGLAASLLMRHIELRTTNKQQEDETQQDTVLAARDDDVEKRGIKASK